MIPDTNSADTFYAFSCTVFNKYSAVVLIMVGPYNRLHVGTGVFFSLFFFFSGGWWGPITYVKPIVSPQNLKRVMMSLLNCTGLYRPLSFMSEKILKVLLQLQ